MSQRFNPVPSLKRFNIYVFKMPSIYWFRKCLRLHDNPALVFALKNSDFVYPVFVLDPYFVKNGNVGPNRWRFLFQSLIDLDKSLKLRNSQLFVLNGNPLEVLEQKIREWKVNLICFESDSEPYSKLRDSKMEELIKSKNLNVKIVQMSSHTLYNLNELYTKNRKQLCTSYSLFLKLIQGMGEPEEPIDDAVTFNFATLPSVVPQIGENLDISAMLDLAFIGIKESDCGVCIYPGGESEALKRMEQKLSDINWICNFQKPLTSPNTIEPSTTVLSPYLKFGNLSARLFYKRLKNIYQSRTNGKYSKPPVSLEGQLLWREFFYFNGAFCANFSCIKGNPICKKIDWDENEEYFNCWKNAKTGFPFIDAIMTQLRQEGWIHHLARHAVACFLTRGDLYISWEKGLEVFENLLLDADWSLNAGNWQWLSASTFFYQYWKVYSPITFGKKTDPNGKFIKKYIPVLSMYPPKYIYEPWTAPLSIQKQCRCIIGKDYPHPIVDHTVVSKKNIARMKMVYEKGKSSVKESQNKKPKLI